MADKKSIRGDIAFGRGSKWHLLRFMGWHRSQFDLAIRKEIAGAGAITWKDMDWNPRGKQHDVEIKGVDFLPKAKQKGWDKFWPAQGNAHNWDGIGIIKICKGRSNPAVGGGRIVRHLSYDFACSPFKVNTPIWLTFGMGCHPGG